jgi:hypothetical protein
VPINPIVQSKTRYYSSRNPGHVTVYKNSVRTSQETHLVSATEPNRLMLLKETVAVYCENHTEHTDTLCGQNVEFGEL